MAKFADPPEPEPTTVQWYRTYIHDSNHDGRATIHDATDGSDRFLLGRHRTDIPDRQLGLVQIEPETEAFSLETHYPEKAQIFFFGGTFTPLDQLANELPRGEMLRRQSQFVYGRLTTHLGKIFWLERFHHYYLKLDENGWLLLPSEFDAKRYQELVVIRRLNRLMDYGHMTLEDAVQTLATCHHSGMSSEETVPWNRADNYECRICGLGYSIDNRSDFDEILEISSRVEREWPNEVRQIADNFPGLAFTGAENICFYRMLMVPKKFQAGTWKVRGYLNRDGTVAA